MGTTDSWRDTTKGELEKAMKWTKEMRSERSSPFLKKLQKDRERSIQRSHSQRR